MLTTHGAALQRRPKTPDRVQPLRDSFDHAPLNTHRGNHTSIDDDYKTAERIFAQHGLAFYHAATQLEHAEWLTDHGRVEEAQPLLTKARDTFEQLEAKPWFERLATAEAGTLAATHA